MLRMNDWRSPSIAMAISETDDADHDSGSVVNPSAESWRNGAAEILTPSLSSRHEVRPTIAALRVFAHPSNQSVANAHDAPACRATSSS
jgi:hypothetical protein